MPKAVTEYFNLDTDQFEATGAFDTMVDWDTKLFVDPFLLKDISTPEFVGAYDELLGYFRGTLKLIAASKNKNDYPWRAAQKRLVFREPGGFGLGYSKESIRGSGIGKGLANQLIKNLKEIVALGINDPELFELLGLFEEGIGCDLISDMTCNILLKRFFQFTERVFNKSGYKEINTKWELHEQIFHLPAHPFTSKSPVLLSPSKLLNDLPVVKDYYDIDVVCSRNSQLRRNLNQVLGSNWKEEVKKHGKKFFRNLFVNHPEILQELLKQYKEARPRRYDFSKDPSGEVHWRKYARQITSDNPLTLYLTPNAEYPEICGVIETICKKFSDHIENNGLWEVLWDDSKTKHRKERIAQKLFYSVAENYCDANNLDISPESNAGRGPVDFKMSRGSKEKVVVEVKYSDSSSLYRNYTNQVKTYQKAEKAEKGYYLVLQMNDHEKRIKKLFELKNKLASESKLTADIIIIDGTPKESASKL